eukprot:12190039-Alexandrium_andersonii.AAC.1
MSGTSQLIQPGSCAQKYTGLLPTIVDSKYTVASCFNATASDQKTAQHAKAPIGCSRPSKPAGLRFA